MPRNRLLTRRDYIRNSVAQLSVGGQRRYPARLRARIVEYCRDRLQEGVSLTSVSSELGVSYPTLSRLLKEPERPRLRRVRISAPQAAASDVRAAVVVRGPSGIVIEGLDVAGVAALVRALS